MGACCESEAPTFETVPEQKPDKVSSPSRFSVRFVKDASLELGVEFTQSESKHCLNVDRVVPGLVEEWNKSNPNKAILQGDNIMEVNGIRAQSEDMLAEIEKATDLILGVEKHQPTLTKRHTFTDTATSVAARRVSAPAPLLVAGVDDELLLGKLMVNRKPDWARARRAARRIRDPTYTTGDFYEDIVDTFPELRLYCISREELDGACSSNTAMMACHSASSGGRTADDEYQRTIGALFCFFWIMRLHLDGRHCFSYGLDSATFAPRTNMSRDTPEAEAEYQKRVEFFQKTDWKSLNRLLIGAGLVGEDPSQPHDEERTLTFLVLMAIHDIMKLDVLRPTVADGIADFAGYKSGEEISDHDVALAYVLEQWPSALPSFRGLSKEQQATIRFTHCKIEYNMGWLVQGEAPPGALFRSFRKTIVNGKAEPKDVALYFVHWFADLAGAEPCPMQGSAKFVLKFPLKVLSTFVNSFQVVWSLGETKTETQVLEEYLIHRWVQQDIGDAPNGKGSIALMRLVLMAQGDSQEIMRQWELLPEKDRQVLEDELAMTGCEDQQFDRDQLGPRFTGKGPAILVYYAPALMQKCGRTDPRQAMLVLAEVFRQARELWPLNESEANRSITVRIDALKDRPAEGILKPAPLNHYVLAKSTGQDGWVKLMPKDDLKDLDWTHHQVLQFGVPEPRRKSSIMGLMQRQGSISSIFRRRSRRAST